MIMKDNSRLMFLRASCVRKPEILEEEKENENPSKEIAILSRTITSQFFFMLNIALCLAICDDCKLLRDDISMNLSLSNT